MELTPGTEEVSINGNITGGTTGSVLFVGPGSTIAQDNANFFWDDTNNRMGIVTNSPSVNLEVVDTIRTSRSGVSATYLEMFGGSGAADPYLNWAGTGTNFRINFSGSPLLTILNDGNVGVGITNPSAKLDVNGILNISGVEGSNGLRWSAGDAEISEASYNLMFKTWTGSDLTEKMRITGSGNVGISTTNPIATFQVGGSQAGNAGFEIVPGSGIVTQAYNRTAGTYASLSFDGSSINFRPEGTSKLFMNTSGVGVGTTSPNANAILDVSSTTKAFMPPRMTTTQKNAISSPTAGMVVYDTDLNKLCVYTTAWETITSA